MSSQKFSLAVTTREMFTLSNENSLNKTSVAKGKVKTVL